MKRFAIFVLTLLGVALRAFLDEQRKHPNVHVIDLYTPTADWDESEFMSGSLLSARYE